MMAQTTPFFTVIIPTYNRVHSILDAVQSVLRQSFKDFELIIIDDGSTDNTADVLKPVIETEARVKYVYQENAERSAARNHGIRLASGLYICFLDSDDEYLPNHLEYFHHHISLLNAERTVLFSKTTSDPAKEETYDWRSMSLSDTDQEFIILNALTSQQACVPRAVLAENRFSTDFKIGEDRELWMRIVENASVVKLSAATVWIKDLGDRSIDLSNLRNAKENLTSLRKAIETGAAQISPEVKLKALAAAEFRLAQSYSKNGQRIHAAFYATRSLVLFRDRYATSILAFILVNLNLHWLLPKRIKANQNQ